MAEAVASKRLDYTDKKARAVSSRASRNIVPCTNGNIFYGASTSTITIAGNNPSTYWDASNSYIRFTAKNNDSTDSIRIESCFALVQKLECLADGQVISSIDNYGALVHAFLDTEVGVQFRGYAGAAMFGTHSPSSALIEIGAGASRTFAMPLLLTPFFSSSRYIPVHGRSNLTIRITWADTSRGTIGSLTNSELIISPCELVATYVRLSAEAQSMVVANCGGRFDIIADDFRCAQSNLTAGADSLNMNCGFSFSSLNRVIWFHLPNYSETDKPSVSNRSKAYLQNFALSINGEEHPRTRILVGDQVAEVVAEIMIGSRSLGDLNHESSLTHTQMEKDEPSGTVTSTAGKYTVGNFVAAIDTESMKPALDPDSLYSGVSTLGAVVQLVAQYDSGSTTPSQSNTVLAFANYTMSLSMDLNGSQTWVVSI